VIHVIPYTVRKLAPEGTRHWKRVILTLVAPAAVGSLALNEPSVLFALVPVWLWQAERLGNCSHCVDSDNSELLEEEEATGEEAVTS
jgi:hypothetical protein